MNPGDCADCAILVTDTQADQLAPLRTKAGTAITEEMLDGWVAEAERGYDLSRLRERPRAEIMDTLFGSERVRRPGQ